VGQPTVCVDCGEPVGERLRALDPPSKRCRSCTIDAIHEYFPEAISKTGTWRGGAISG
jgi:hypothetical protein